MVSRTASLPTLAGLALPPATAAAPRFALGLAAVDARLGGGLAVAALHELYAQSDSDAASVAAFALRPARPDPVAA